MEQTIKPRVWSGLMKRSLKLQPCFYNPNRISAQRNLRMPKSCIVNRILGCNTHETYWNILSWKYSETKRNENDHSYTLITKVLIIPNLLIGTILLVTYWWCSKLIINQMPSLGTPSQIVRINDTSKKFLPQFWFLFSLFYFYFLYSSFRS